ncbi:SAM-dependent methyltransferase [Virgibacillus necropolis]|uniref:SAM-dependent methyltransferase n=1 Tax=Virgibacillus necropolis TaxID=163877 RepID=A0A221M8A7_9BACI|nr:class I SAM-dependent methyltransferase [Virgibacillus necropolis]ASN03874.1 SAM-dependent methyltransferase [Virgibacillus necropolis]
MSIHTGGYQKESNRSYHYHPYEPTQYSALEVLFDSYELKSSDHMVDFGCGKGRLNFFANYFYQAHVTGVEMDPTFYQIAIENQSSYRIKNKQSNDKIHFHCCLAEDYHIDRLDNRFYFFNPFSKEIFMNVVNNILRSVEVSEREVDLIVYYPSDDYIFYLENDTVFKLKEEIRLPGYKDDSYERFLIYRLN